MPMKYGFLNLCFEREIRSGKIDHGRIFKWARENGFDGVEIYLPTLTDLSWHSIDLVRKSLREHSLSISQVSHETGFLCLDEVSRRYCERYYALAVEVASVMESPYLRATSGAQVIDAEEAVSRSVDALTPILNLADDYDLYITLENHPGVEEAFVVLSGIFRKCRSKRLKFNFDAVNSLVAGENPLHVLKNLSGSLVHVHACDVVSKENHEKTVIGKGAVPWAQIMKMLKDMSYAGYLSIEYFGENPAQALNDSKDYLKAL